MMLKDSERYVLIIGSSNMDLNIYSERLPRKGETVTGGIFKQFLGGKGANQAVASVRAGAKTIFIGKVGRDSFGNQMLNQLSDEGIDVSHIFLDPDEASGVAFIMIDKQGENMISVAPGANAKLSVDNIRACHEIIVNATVIVVQMEIPTETIIEIFNIASEGKVIKILNPAPLKPIPKSLMKKIDILIPNEGELYELHRLFGFKDDNSQDMQKIIKISKDIASLGIKWIITTLGNKGCVIYNSEKDSISEIPAFKVKAVDTVGAGDCFNGVLASKLCQGESLENAVKYAVAAASIAVTRKGAQASMPYKEEIEERFRQFN
ncbi:MAG: ribokinase [Promethearchaeota archaeon]